MIITPARSLLFVAFVAVTSQAAWALPRYQGAWLDEGQVCAKVFVAQGKAISFKRPANAFASAFVVRGHQLSTPLATCRIVRITSSGEREVLNLSCTTSIATNAAHAVLTHVRDGALYRFSIPQGGSGVRCRLCTREVLNEPRAEFRAAAPPHYYHLI